MGPLSGATIPGHSGPGSVNDEVVLRIPQSSSITGTSISDRLVSYLGHSLEGAALPSAEKQLTGQRITEFWNLKYLT